VKLLLIYPNLPREFIGYGDLGAIAEPLALEYLGAGAAADGHLVRVLDLRLHPTELDEVLRTFAPDVVGVTAYSFHVLRVLDICRRVKELLPDCRTVVGGHHATVMPDDFFQPQIDFVVCGEGVRPTRALLSAIEKGDLGCGIPGVWFRTGETFEAGGNQEPFIIDDLPFPDRNLTGLDRDRYFIDWMKPIALLRTGVGCPYRCSFCSLWQIMDGKYHLRAVDSVVAELRLISERHVFIVDDEPFLNKTRMQNLADEIRRADVRKQYFAYCRVDSLLRQRDLLREWRDIGLVRLFLGIEAIDSDELLDYNKRITINQIEEALSVAKDLDIKLFSQFIISPDYTRQDFQRVMRFIERNKIEYPSFTILTPLPGTASLSTFTSVVERQSTGRPNWTLFDLQHPVTQTVLPREEFMREYHNLHRVFGHAYSGYARTAHQQSARIVPF
jgi:radical SAM superfamily enzyme YgiQ (UPF0313 family)